MNKIDREAERRHRAERRRAKAKGRSTEAQGDSGGNDKEDAPTIHMPPRLDRYRKSR